jgi:hypothetical protein
MVHSTIYNVWFWAPFHMLQAYPMARNLPIPDAIIPLAHLMWVPMYIGEHWTGLAEPVQDAWNMRSFTTPISGILLLTFFFCTHKMSDHQNLVKIGAVFYFAFMFFAGDLGFEGKPQPTYVRLFLDLMFEQQYLDFLSHSFFCIIPYSVGPTNRCKRRPRMELSAHLPSCILPGCSMGCCTLCSIQKTFSHKSSRGFCVFHPK